MPEFSFLSRWLGPSGPNRGSLLQKRIPTILGLGILVLGIVVGLQLVGSDTASQFLPRATEDAIPRQVRITNVTDSGFTVSFLTDTASPGYVSYGTDQNRTNIQVRDDRDKLANTVASYLTHHITVQGLDPSTQYYFVIGTGDRSEFDNNGAPFAVRTARRLTSDAETRTAYGNVRNAVSNPADGAIVYLSIQGAAPLSALVKPNGSWAVQLTNLYTQDLSALYPYAAEDTVRVQVQGIQRDQTINFDTTVGALTPLQDLMFGEDPTIAAVEETEEAIVADPTPTPDPSEETQTGSDSVNNGFDTMLDTQTTDISGASTTPDIEIVLENNEQIASQRPEFLGTAPPNSFLQIELHSDAEIFDVAQVDASGNWSWTPSVDLDPGEHTITVTYTSDQGNQQQLVRNFTILADGESALPAFTSSPSGGLATPTPTPTPMVTPTPSPSPVPTPTPTPTPLVTPTPTSLTSSPATQSAQPISGSSSMTLFLAAIGSLFFGIGMFITRRSMQNG